MNLLFVHGHKFRRVDGHIYSPGGLQEDVLMRYAKWFGKVTVVGRIIDECETKKSYREISHPMIKVINNEDLLNLVKEADAIITRLPSVNGYKAVSLAKKYKKPYLIEVVACVWDAYWNYGIKGKIVAFPAMKIMQSCIKNASYVVYVSQSFLQKRYPTKGKSVSISDVELIKTKDETLINRINKIDKENKEKLVIGTTAAIDVPHKGQEYIIRALPLIKDQLGIEIEYELVGGGNPDRLYEIAKENGVEHNVRFLGFMNHDDVFPWLDSIDIYIQSSFQEGLCRALVEAMSRGLPCVASAVGGNPELIDSKYIFAMNNKREISNRICELVCQLASEDQLKEQAQKNFEHANSTFDKDFLARKRDEFYLAFKSEVEKDA